MTLSSRSVDLAQGFFFDLRYVMKAFSTFLVYENVYLPCEVFSTDFENGLVMIPSANGFCCKGITELTL